MLFCFFKHETGFHGSYVLKLEKAEVYRLPYLSSSGPGFGLVFTLIIMLPLFIENEHVGLPASLSQFTVAMTLKSIIFFLEQKWFPPRYPLVVMFSCMFWFPALLEEAKKVNFSELLGEISCGLASGR